MRERQITELDHIGYDDREEGHTFDNKAFHISGKKVQKIASAFSNADGGDFVIGIADRKEEADIKARWQGQLIEAFNGHIQALGEVQPSIDADYTFLRVLGRPGAVLLVSVQKSSEVCRTSAGDVYQRKGAQSLPLNSDQVLHLSFAKGASSFEDYVVSVEHPEEIIDSQELLTFLGAYSPKTDGFEISLAQNLIDRQSLSPRVAGLLLFADNPPAHLPRKCGVRITRYKTKEDDPERDQLDISIPLSGPLCPLIRDTILKVTQIMSSVNVWTTKGLQRLEYPPEAIWEIVANAFIHRDYSISDDIQILIFDNRIEVLSPGRLPGYVTVSNILGSRFSRNSKLVNILTRYPDPPNKDLGEGLNTAFQKMKESKLKAPEIFQEANHVRVVIPHVTLASATDAILEFLETHLTITNSQARGITGIKSENAMKNEFYKLRDQGKLEMVPEKKGSAAAWRLTQAVMDPLH